MTDDQKRPRAIAVPPQLTSRITQSDASDATPPTPKKSFGFYAIIVALALTNLLTALEQTITADLGGASLYVWAVNGYYLTQTAFQPFFGQMADIYGRKRPIIMSAAMFTVGSGVPRGGGSTNMQTLIAGRLLQGIGGGGILVLTEVIICDLLPLRERGKYLGMIVSLVGIGAALGPLFGGLIVQHSSWPWVFYLNVPIGGAVLGATPSRSGIQLLPTILFMIPGAIAGGTLLSKFGRYRPIQHSGFALMIIGFGLLTLLDADSNTGEWVGYQLLGAFGTGLVLPVLLPAVQAPLTEEDTALCTSMWSFIRTFGFIWGGTIATAVFNNRIDTLAPRIANAAIRAQLTNGQAYERATKIFIDSIADPATVMAVRSVYVDSLNVVWFVSLAFAGLGFLLVFLERERKELDSKFAMDEKEKEKKSETETET